MPENLYWTVFGLAVTVALAVATCLAIVVGSHQAAANRQKNVDLQRDCLSRGGSYLVDSGGRPVCLQLGGSR